MKQKFTYVIWAGLCLFLLAQNVQAQYPKYLSQYPIIKGTSDSSINALAQKGNVVYLAGNFSTLQKIPANKYGLVFNKYGDAAPNKTAVSPNIPPAYTISDGGGGWYIFGDVSPNSFTQVGGVDRQGMARINADGTLNSWNPNISTFGATDKVTQAIAINGNVLIAGSFTNLNGTNYSTPLAMLDGTTGKQLPGWSNLVYPGFSIGTNVAVQNISFSNNLLYVYGQYTATGIYGTFQLNAFEVIDVSDVNNPKVIGSTYSDADTFLQSTGPFHIDLQDQVPANEGGPDTLLSYSSVFVSGSRAYLSGYGYDANFAPIYNNQTSTGQSINTALFSVDAATGKNIVSFNLPIVSIGTFSINSIVNDGNIVYVLFSSQGAIYLKAFNSTTGADISASQPDLSAIQIALSQNLQLNPLFITSDHKLLITGNLTVNGISKNSALLDIATGTLQPDWNLPASLTNLNHPATTPINYNLIESNGEYLVYGNIAYSPGGPAYKSLAAMDATTGEILNWVPADFTGVFNSMAINGNTLYIGGQFSDANGAVNLAAYDITNPANPVLKADWKPMPSGSVNALLVNGTKLYAGGSFTTVSGQLQNNLAEFDISNGTGTLNTTWNPVPDDAVTTLAVLNNVLYAGGNFSKIGSSTRNYAAAFNLNSNNALTAWDPQITVIPTVTYVNAITAQAIDGVTHNARIFIGGRFGQFGGGIPTTNLAVVNTTDGAPDVWQLSDPQLVNINALAIANNTLYAGGLRNLESADVSTNAAPQQATTVAGVTANKLGATGKGVEAILTDNNLLFAAGDFSSSTADPLVSGFVAYQISDATPVITFADITNTYGDAPFAPAATSTVTTNPITYSIATGDNPDNVISLADGKITILKPGVATITASQTGAADVKAKITISKAILTVVPNDATTVVNQAFPDFPFTLTGWKNGDDTKTGIYTGKPVFASTGTSSSPAGTYDLTVSGAGTLTSDYYTFTLSTAKATLTINTTGSTVQTITFAALPTKTYGDADITLGATTSAAGLSIMYKSSDDNIATVTGNRLHISGAGTVTITASQAGDPTYAPAADVPQTFTIAKAALTIKADDKTINRGDQLPAFTGTYTGLVNGDAATDLDTPPTFTTTATQSSAPGPYPITAADAASDNYTITFVNGTLTIKGTQIITFAPVSTLTYGDAAFDPGATSDAGASFKPVYTTSNPSVIAISGGQAVIKGAGTATITATFAAANGFDLTTATENITVQPKALTVTADDKTKNFGDPLPAFTITYNGFVNSDTYTTPGVFSTPPVAATTATAISPAGTYPITVSGGISTNYTLSYFPGTLTVVPVARTITFNALPNKTYGDADFNPGATANTGETPVYTASDQTVATIVNGQIHLTGAGSTTITATFSSNAGYTGATTVSQTLTVAKTKLTITADNLTKTQGPPNITLTASYSGFVNNDNELNLTAPASLTTTASADSPTGTYPITVSGASSPNYDITYVNGTLTIIFGVGQDQIVVHPMLSPNGDGKNDFMLIDGIQNYPDNHVVVVDRNGAKVYEARGYDNSSIVFAGKNNSGNSLVAGTYYYEVNYTLKGNTQRKAGYIIIKY